jgi:hypothetical protein
MFDVIQISRAEYKLKNARLNDWEVVEGTIVQVPNIFDRAVLAIRTVLTGRRPVASQPQMHYGHGAVVTK